MAQLRRLINTVRHDAGTGEKPPRRWFAFRLRTLFVVVAVLSVPMAWFRLPYSVRIPFVRPGQGQWMVTAILGKPSTDIDHWGKWGAEWDGWHYSDDSGSYRVMLGRNDRPATKGRWAVIRIDRIEPELSEDSPAP